jgi:hypothetical protein
MATTKSEKGRTRGLNGTIVYGTFTTTGTAGNISTGHSLIYHVDLTGTTGHIAWYTTGSFPLTSGSAMFATTGAVSGTYSIHGKGY